MIKWGNAKCNAYWESKLSDGYIPDALKIENFIRTKYDLKKWVASATIPNPLSMKAAAPAVVVSQQPLAPQKSVLQLAPAPHKAPSAPASLVNLLDDIFSLPSPATGKPQPLQKAPTPPLTQSTGGLMGLRPDLKKLILSLYSSPLASNTFLPQQQQQQQQQPLYLQPSHLLSVNSVASSLQGLSFNSQPQRVQPVRQIPQQIPQQQQQPQQVPAQKQQSSQKWNNEWSDSTPSWQSSQKPAMNLNGLDDDLFKNVWN